MKFFLNIGRLLAILILGFMVSALVSIPAIADYQTLGVSAISGDVPIVEDLKSLDQIGDYLTLTKYSGLINPGFLHKIDIFNNPFAGLVAHKEEMLNIAYSRPGAC